MRELAHIRLRAVEGFLIDNLGQSFFRQRQRPALFRHELTLRQPTLTNPTRIPHTHGASHESDETQHPGGPMA
jgi:hypothetical protein